jgi:hypothetical protein
MKGFKVWTVWNMSQNYADLWLQALMKMHSEKQGGGSGGHGGHPGGRF